MLYPGGSWLGIAGRASDAGCDMADAIEWLARPCSYRASGCGDGPNGGIVGAIMTNNSAIVTVGWWYRERVP